MQQRRAKTLNPEMKRALDEHVDAVLRNKECTVCLSAKSKLLEGASPREAAVILSMYADMAAKKCKVSYTNNVWRFEAYEEGEPRDRPRTIDVDDFALIDQYLSYGTPAVVNAKMLEVRGLNFKTKRAKHWLLIKTYFDMHPEYRVLWSGVIELWSKHKPQTSYFTYFVCTQNVRIQGTEAEMRNAARAKFQEAAREAAA